MFNYEASFPKMNRSEWFLHGDPRCSESHYRPKRNLSEWIRDSHDWTQKRLAEKVGTDASTLSKWLTGTRYLTDASLVKIALATHLSLPFILDLRKYGEEYSTSKNTTFGPELFQTRAQLQKHYIHYVCYWHLLELEDGALMDKQIDDDLFVTDTSYYDHVYPEPAYVDVDVDPDYEHQLIQTPYFYSESIRVMERDNYDHPGDYRDPSHLAEALFKEYVDRGWGPNTLDRLGSLIP